jgi:hypothetical protein
MIATVATRRRRPRNLRARRPISAEPLLTDVSRVIRALPFTSRGLCLPLRAQHVVAGAICHYPEYDGPTHLEGHVKGFFDRAYQQLGFRYPGTALALHREHRAVVMWRGDPIQGQSEPVELYAPAREAVAS